MNLPPGRSETEAVSLYPGHSVHRKPLYTDFTEHLQAFDTMAYIRNQHSDIEVVCSQALQRQLSIVEHQTGVESVQLGAWYTTAITATIAISRRRSIQRCL